MKEYTVLSTLSTKDGYKYPGETVSLTSEQAAKLLGLGVVAAVEPAIKKQVKKENDHGSDN